ncbi:hypothetical protein [Flagellimonas eckloniae]|uniref:Alginate lyase domain-containing protein n=1 Tax=Flagellimonas eckloniae TaxID=346185 RepID=A0A0Q0XGF8_9FLAO|nr:hypothetical protein [Allomuricauda eckloniae]KQC30168.1 hypothetical protein AAY42_09980 [Allomuricauda eckloniae]
MKNILYILFFVLSTSFGQQSLVELKDLYDREYNGSTTGSDGNDVNINPNLGFDSANPNQEFYRSADSFMAELLMWRSTGSIVHFNRMKGWIDNMESDAVDVQSGGQTYKGWPSTSQCGQSNPSVTEIDRCANGTPLWEFFIGRFVMEFLKDIHHSPTFKAQLNLDYPNWWQGRVDWWEENVFEKWYNNTEQNGGALADNAYRNRTHMATEVAQMAACIYAINGNTTAKDVYDNIMFNGMPGSSNHSGESMAGQLEYDSGNDLYEWSSIWGNSASIGPQDVNHNGHMIPAVVTGYEVGEHWTVTDLIRFANTTNRTVSNFNNYNFYRNVDLSGGTGSNGDLSDALMLRITQWNESMHDNFADNADANDANRAPFAGTLYYNEYMLQNGRPIYPEHWVPVDGVFGGTSNPNPTPGNNDNATLINSLRWFYDH